MHETQVGRRLAKLSARHEIPRRHGSGSTFRAIREDYTPEEEPPRPSATEGRKTDDIWVRVFVFDTLAEQRGGLPAGPCGSIRPISRWEDDDGEKSF